MQKHVFVIVLKPEDLQELNAENPTPDKPVFGIVEEVLDKDGRYQDFPCRVRGDNGESEILPIGRLCMLLELSEEEAMNSTPEEVFARWGAEILKTRIIIHLPISQRDFLSRMALNAT